MNEWAANRIGQVLPEKIPVVNTPDGKTGPVTVLQRASSPPQGPFRSFWHMHSKTGENCNICSNSYLNFFANGTTEATGHGRGAGTVDISGILQRAPRSLHLDETLRQDEDTGLFRGRRAEDGQPVLAILPVSDRPPPEVVGRLEHEFTLREDLALPWAAPPLELLTRGRQLALVLQDPGGLPLESLLQTRHRLTVAECLRLGSGIAAALAEIHARGLIHKDLKPAHVLVDLPRGAVALTGFGVAERLARGQPEVGPPVTLVGTLAYMAPEQTGRLNRPVDDRADLYSLGAVLYEALTGTLPFAARDPLELIHAHLAQQPVPPSQRDPSLPRLLSDLILKLLAKAPEERYQTARGVEADLRRSLELWERMGRLDAFPLAEYDVPDRPLLPGKLYGRGREVRQLLEIWGKVASGAGPALVLVSGYAGVGKSSLVRELRKALAPSQGMFAAGKFDQYQRDIPFATLAQAFQSLLRGILAGPEETVAGWKRAVADAIGPNGRVLAEIVPELEHLLGPQPPVPELAPSGARNRFRAVVTAFLRVLATREHPLVLFLDDLQWLDPAALELLEHLFAQSRLRHLLLVGAYRDNEVDGAHPLALARESIRRAGGSVSEIALAPLAFEQVERLTADMLRSPAGRIEPLARIIHRKTGGNPFFAIQFLGNLYEEGLLAYSPAAGRWTWDPERVAAKGFAENVADLMAQKVTRLSGTAQEALKALAILGMSADVDLIARAVGLAGEQVGGHLSEAESTGLLVRAGANRAFAHDRVREAAYSLIEPGERPMAHLRMGRLLLEDRGESAAGEDLFELAGHYNEGLALIEDPEERERIRRLDVRAARNAKAAGAYLAARSCLIHARSLLPEDAWNSRYPDAFATFLDLSECEFLAGRFGPANDLFDELLRRADSSLDRASIHRARIRLFQVTGKHAEAVASGIEALRILGVEIPGDDQSAQAAAEAEADAIRTGLAGRTLADIGSLPDIVDPDACHRAQMVLDLLTEIRSSAYSVARPFISFFILKGVSFCLQHGNTDAACMAYSGYAALLAIQWGDVETAMAVSSMSMALNERYQDAKRRPAVVGIHGTVCYWGRSLAAGRSFMAEAFRSAVNVGDYVYGGYAASAAGWLAIEAGLPVKQARAEMKPYLEFAANVGNEVILGNLRMHEQFLACLEGATNGPSSFDDGAFKEEECLAIFRESGYLPAIGSFRILKQIAAFLLGQYGEALEHARQAAGLRGDLFVMPIHTMGHFFHALTLAALHPGALPERKAELAEELERTLPMLKSWSEHCPGTFFCRYALVRAEKARIEGKDLEAMRFYEQAIASARENGHIHMESLACELVARYFLERGLDRSASPYLRDARAGYLRWGATAKVDQLDRQFPGLEKPAAPLPTATLGAPLAQLDLPHVIKASQAVSGEIELGRLVEILLRLVQEQAGADRGLLILPRGGVFVVEAEAVTGPDGVHFRMPRAPAVPGQISETVFRYVVRTKERVLMEESPASGPFAEDPYLQLHKPRSLLCLPLLKQSRLVGVLYLENRLASGAFTPGRVATLEILASQAAIALENARLYATLEEERTQLHAVIRQVKASEERFSKAFHNNPTAMAILRRKDWVFAEVNGAFLSLLGYARHEVVDHFCMEFGTWFRELLEQAGRRLAEGKAFGGEELTAADKAGTQKTLLASMDTIELAGESCFLASFADLTERKHVEEQLRQSQKMEAIGSLAGGVAHDFNNLLTAINGYSELVMMGMEDTDPKQELVRSILISGERAAGLTRQLLAFSRKEAIETRVQGLNTIVGEMEKMLQRLIEEHVALSTRLDPEAGSIDADRGQVEQVLLNLVVNARDAMPNGGELRVETQHVVLEHPPSDALLPVGPGRYATLTVRDTGTGMTPEVRAKIFEPFFTTKGVGKGTGLGLAVVYGVMKRVGGGIVVRSLPGQGTTFRLYFPEAREQEAETREGQADSAPQPLQGAEKVLVVEDEPGVRTFIRKALSAQGYQVLEAGNGREALEMLGRGEAVDLVLTDLIMPGVGGRELAEQVREVSPGLPILYTSGYSRDLGPFQEMLAHGEHFLAKPFGPVDLARKVRQILDRLPIEG